jgi:hypothetical protein
MMVSKIPETGVRGGRTLTLRLKVEMEHEDGFGSGVNSLSWFGLLACSRVRFALPTLENEFERCSNMAHTTRSLLFDLWQHLGIPSPRRTMTGASLAPLSGLQSSVGGPGTLANPNRDPGPPRCTPSSKLRKCLDSSLLGTAAKNRGNLSSHQAAAPLPAPAGPSTNLPPCSTLSRSR